MHEVHPTSLGILLPLDLLDLNFADITFVITDETSGIEQPSTVTPLLMAARSLKHHGPVRPGSIGIIPYRRFGHNLYLRYRRRTLAVSRAHTVAAGIATTDYEYVLTLCRDSILFRYFLTGIHTVLLLKQFECEMYALEFTSLDL